MTTRGTLVAFDLSKNDPVTRATAYICLGSGAAHPLSDLTLWQFGARRARLKGDGLTTRERKLEVWGGIECTVNRVGETFFSQLDRSGHGDRIEDLDVFTGLGIAKLRYPVLWEMVAPTSPNECNWRWTDERMGRLRELGLEPIVGLVHHGSGPSYTDLLDPHFPELLAKYAGKVAERYPWLRLFTPVNEPLTTARFSALYGHWYPHSRDPLSFARALLTQCRATILAMRAIREVIPDAQLIQTEDLGKTHSTHALRYQAEFENERRWLSFDLLAGKLDREMPMWHYLRWVGVEEQELEWFLDNDCPPDVLGINHYLTSERYLDHQIDAYPAHTHGSNGRDEYADVEAVRAMVEGVAGPETLLVEAWERYGIPVAVTEAHLGCTREEQVRWLYHVWDSAERARERGVDVLGVTAWSLLGAYDWASLLTRGEGLYEPGVFDMRAPQPRPTALAAAIKDLASGDLDRPCIYRSQGWWTRDRRLQFPPCFEPEPIGCHAQPILITGGTGTLGRAFSRLCEIRGLSYRLLTRKDMDIADEGSVARALEEIRPWEVINAAGFVRVDDAETEAGACYRENTHGSRVLAEACVARGIRLVNFSSDLVFDGYKGAAYLESDQVEPLGVYGRSKALAEGDVLEILPSALVVRTSAFFGPWDEHSFALSALRTVGRGERFMAASDAIVSPTYVPDLVHATLDLLLDGHEGIQHLANEGAVSWADFARMIVREAGLDVGLVLGRATCEFGWAAERPLYSVLGSERAWVMPSLERGVSQFFEHLEFGWGSEAVVGRRVFLG